MGSHLVSFLGGNPPRKMPSSIQNMPPNQNHWQGIGETIYEVYYILHIQTLLLLLLFALFYDSVISIILVVVGASKVETKRWKKLTWVYVLVISMVACKKFNPNPKKWLATFLLPQLIPHSYKQSTHTLLTRCIHSCFSLLIRTSLF